MLWRSGLPCQEVALTPRLFLESGDSETSSSGIFEMAIYRKPDFRGCLAIDNTARQSALFCWRWLRSTFPLQSGGGPYICRHCLRRHFLFESLVGWGGHEPDWRPVSKFRLVGSTVSNFTLLSQTVPDLLSRMPKAIWVASRGTSRTTSQSCQVVVPLIGRSCILSKLTIGGPLSTRIQSPAQSRTSSALTNALNRSRFPAYWPAPNWCISVPNPSMDGCLAFR
jgi:hypothetical protein